MTDLTDLDYSFTGKDRDGIVWLQVLDLSAGKVVTSWPCKNSDQGRSQFQDFIDDLQDRLA